MNKNDYCIIMAGGIGSRFWPLSRNSRPKQFLDILGTGKTFIQQTYERFSRIIPSENFLVVTGNDYKDLVLEQIPELSAAQVLCEPMRRNTAPCVAYATYKLHSKNPKARVVVTPADHAISNEIAFLEVIRNGIEYAGDNKALVTIGLKPSRPETGYGYIQINKHEKKLCRDSICKVKTFTEKPNLETAKLFIESGEFYWNSGIFIWSIASIKQAIELHLPEIAELFAQGLDKYDTPAENSFIADTYSQCPNISVDYGIMEKAENVYVFGADFGWSDVGTWNSLYHQTDKDNNLNAVKGEPVFLREVTNCTINSSSSSKLIVVNELDGYMIVDTEDVLMICPRDNEDSIKQLIADALAEKGSEFA